MIQEAAGGQEQLAPSVEQPGNSVSSAGQDRTSSAIVQRLEEEAWSILL